MRIVHAAETLESDEIGLQHAVALAARCGASLTSIHAYTNTSPAKLPNASELLARWGITSRGVPHHWWLQPIAEDAAETLLQAVHELEPDLLVASTRACGGASRILSGSVAEALARNSCVPVLLLPVGGRSLVDPATGALQLRRLLLPAGDLAHTQRAVEAAATLLHSIGEPAGELVLLHVMDGSAAAPPSPPAHATLTYASASGPLETAVARCARAQDADMVVMSTRGHDGLLDVLLASHTERVLHTLDRPLLWVPR